LRFLAPKLGLSTSDIFIVADYCGIQQLSSRRLFNDVSYVYKLINNHVDCPEPLSKISFKVPTFNSRNNSLFHIDFHCQNYSYYGPLNRMLMSTNKFVNSDFFNDSLC